MSYRQVAGPDAGFLYGERPEWHFHVSALLLLDPSTTDRFSFREVVDQVRRRVHRAPQFRWKLVEGPLRLRLERPIWVDDPDFDVARHIHRVAVAAPGDERALGELIGRLVSYKIDRSRPLWEMWVIEGLADGRVALLAKIHHAIIDGQSGAELVTLLYDTEPDPAPEPEPPPYLPEPPPSFADRLGRAAGHALAWPLQAGRFAEQLVRQGVDIGRAAREPEPPAAPMQAPRCSLNGKLTPDRDFASAAVPVADVKRVKDAFGVTFNDVVLALAAGAARSYLEGIDDLPDRPLIAQVPVSHRDGPADDHIGTKVGAMFCSLATDIEDPVERLRAVHSGSARSKELHADFTRHHRVNLTDTLPPAAIALAARAWSLADLDRRSPPLFSFVVSNVAGPPFDLYLAGARIDAMYPMGPILAGSGLNLTVVSLGESLHFGLMTCPALIPDPWAFAEALPPALDELLQAADQAS